MFWFGYLHMFQVSLYAGFSENLSTWVFAVEAISLSIQHDRKNRTLWERMISILDFYDLILKKPIIRCEL